MKGEIIIIKIFDNWHYQQDETDSKNDDPLIAIKDVCLMMLNSFDEKANTSLSIIDNKPLGYPICLDNNQTIFLSTSGNTYWAQNAYQLSHELCHHFIKKKSPTGDNSWFEESICELSSLYFLSVLASNWEKSPVVKKTNYSVSLKEYYSDVLKNSARINLKSLNVKISKLYKEMNEDPYLRDKNKCVAIKMLPIFTEFPSLWKDVYLIRKCNISDLRRFFTEWSTLASDNNTKAIQKISKLFL